MSISQKENSSALAALGTFLTKVSAPSVSVVPSAPSAPSALTPPSLAPVTRAVNRTPPLPECGAKTLGGGGGGGGGGSDEESTYTRMEIQSEQDTRRANEATIIVKTPRMDFMQRIFAFLVDAPKTDAGTLLTFDPDDGMSSLNASSKACCVTELFIHKSFFTSFTVSDAVEVAVNATEIAAAIKRIARVAPLARSLAPCKVPSVMGKDAAGGGGGGDDDDDDDDQCGGDQDGDGSRRRKKRRVTSATVTATAKAATTTDKRASATHSRRKKGKKSPSSSASALDGIVAEESTVLVLDHKYTGDMVVRDDNNLYSFPVMFQESSKNAASRRTARESAARADACERRNYISAHRLSAEVDARIRTMGFTYRVLVPVAALKNTFENAIPKKNTHVYLDYFELSHIRIGWDEPSFRRPCSRIPITTIPKRGDASLPTPTASDRIEFTEQNEMPVYTGTFDRAYLALLCRVDLHTHIEFHFPSPMDTERNLLGRGATPAVDAATAASTASTASTEECTVDGDVSDMSINNATVKKASGDNCQNEQSIAIAQTISMRMKLHQDETLSNKTQSYIQSWVVPLVCSVVDV